MDFVLGDKAAVAAASAAGHAERITSGHHAKSSTLPQRRALLHSVSAGAFVGCGTISV